VLSEAALIDEDFTRAYNFGQLIVGVAEAKRLQRSLGWRKRGANASPLLVRGG
jgi:hypothetical protein